MQRLGLGGVNPLVNSALLAATSGVSRLGAGLSPFTSPLLRGGAFSPLLGAGGIRPGSIGATVSPTAGPTAFFTQAVGDRTDSQRTESQLRPQWQQTGELTQQQASMQQPMVLSQDMVGGAIPSGAATATPVEAGTIQWVPPYSLIQSMPLSVYGSYPAPQQQQQQQPVQQQQFGAPIQPQAQMPMQMQLGVTQQPITQQPFAQQPISPYGAGIEQQQQQFPVHVQQQQQQMPMMQPTTAMPMLEQQVAQQPSGEKAKQRAMRQQALMQQQWMQQQMQQQQQPISMQQQLQQPVTMPEQLQQPVTMQQMQQPFGFGAVPQQQMQQPIAPQQFMQTPFTQQQPQQFGVGVAPVTNGIAPIAPQAQQSFPVGVGAIPPSAAPISPQTAPLTPPLGFTGTNGVTGFPATQPQQQLLPPIGTSVFGVPVGSQEWVHQNINPAFAQVLKQGIEWTGQALTPAQQAAQAQIMQQQLLQQQQMINQMQQANGMQQQQQQPQQPIQPMVNGVTAQQMQPGMPSMPSTPLGVQPVPPTQPQPQFHAQAVNLDDMRMATARRNSALLTPLQIQSSHMTRLGNTAGNLPLGVPAYGASKGTSVASASRTRIVPGTPQPIVAQMAAPAPISAARYGRDGNPIPIRPTLDRDMDAKVDMRAAAKNTIPPIKDSRL